MDWASHGQSAGLPSTPPPFFTHPPIPYDCLAHSPRRKSATDFSIKLFIRLSTWDGISGRNIPEKSALEKDGFLEMLFLEHFQTC